MTEETKQRISKALQGNTNRRKTISAFTKESDTVFNYVGTWDSLQEASEATDTPISSISKAVNGTMNKTWNGYYWQWGGMASWINND